MCERDEIGGGFAEIVTLGEQASEVDVARAGGIDLSVRACGTGRVVDDIEIERALDGAGRRKRQPGVQRIGAGGIERIGRIGEAMQRLVDRDRDEAYIGERVCNGKHVRAVSADAVLEDHHRPAGGRPRAARHHVGGGGVRNAYQHRYLNRFRGDRQRIEARQIAAARIERRRSALPVARQGSAAAQVIGNAQRADIDGRVTE